MEGNDRIEQMACGRRVRHDEGYGRGMRPTRSVTPMREARDVRPVGVAAVAARGRPIRGRHPTLDRHHFVDERDLPEAAAQVAAAARTGSSWSSLALDRAVAGA
jgi:hypothetical protein